MPKTLDRDLVMDEVVVVQTDHMNPDFFAREKRLFRCRGGFAMYKAAAGRKVLGTWVADGEEGWIRREWIDVDETAVYQAEQTAATK